MQFAVLLQDMVRRFLHQAIHESHVTHSSKKSFVSRQKERSPNYGFLPCQSCSLGQHGKRLKLWNAMMMMRILVCSQRLLLNRQDG